MEIAVAVAALPSRQISPYYFQELRTKIVLIATAEFKRLKLVIPESLASETLASLA